MNEDTRGRARRPFRRGNLAPSGGNASRTSASCILLYTRLGNNERSTSVRRPGTNRAGEVAEFIRVYRDIYPEFIRPRRLGTSPIVPASKVYMYVY